MLYLLVQPSHRFIAIFSQSLHLFGNNFSTSLRSGFFSPRLVTTRHNLDVFFRDTSNHTVIFIYDFLPEFQLKVPFIYISNLASNAI